MTFLRTSPRDRRRPVVTQALVWRGVTLSVSYDPEWFMPERERDLPQAHLEVRVIAPEAARLPITETGYRSQFLAPVIVEAQGGPAAYMSAWLNEASTAPEWRRREEESRQLSLF